MKVVAVDPWNCETARARISRIDLESPEATSTVVDEWFGLTFNSPNDI